MILPVFWPSLGEIPLKSLGPTIYFPPANNYLPNCQYSTQKKINTFCNGPACLLLGATIARSTLLSVHWHSQPTQISKLQPWKIMIPSSAGNKGAIINLRNMIICSKNQVVAFPGSIEMHLKPVPLYGKLAMVHVTKRRGLNNKLKVLN